MDSGFDFFRISRISIGEYRNYVYVFYIYQKSLHIPCIYIYIYSIFRYMYTASRIPNSGRWNWNSLASWIVGLLYGRNYTGEGKMYTWSKTHTTCPTYLLLLRIWSNSRLSSGNEARLTAHDQWIIAIQKCFYPTLCIPMHIWISSLHLDVSPSLHLVIPSLSMPLHWHAKEFGIFFFFFFWQKDSGNSKCVRTSSPFSASLAMERSSTNANWRHICSQLFGGLGMRCHWPI